MKFWKDTLSQHNLIVDISAGSVGIAITELRERGVPEILSAVRTTFHMPKGASIKVREKAMIQSLRKSLSKTKHILFRSEEESGGRIEVSKVAIAFSSPWLLTRLETKKVQDSNGFTLDQEMVADILSIEEENFRKLLQKEYVEETTVFESKVAGIYQNGYETKLPRSKKVHSAELRMMMSATKTALIRNIENEVMKVIGLEGKVALSSFMFSFLGVLKGSFADIHSALLASQTSETMEFLFLKNGNSILNTSIPFGTHRVLDIVSQHFDVPRPVAHSYLALFAENSLEPVTHSRIESLLIECSYELKELWKKGGMDPNGGDYTYTIFFVGLYPLEAISKRLLQLLFPQHQIITVGGDNQFTREIVSYSKLIRKDERLGILSSYIHYAL